MKTATFADGTTVPETSRTRQSPARRTMRINWVLGLGLLAIFASLPLFNPGEFILSLATTLLITGIAVASLHLIIRLGHVSLGHGAFMGLGAYASVICVMTYGLPFPVALGFAFVVPAALGLVIGPMLLRLSGKYFVLVTFLLGEIVRLVFVSWQSFTGGSNGIFGIPVPYKFLATPTAFFYFTLLLTICCIGLIARILQSEIGRMIDSIREDSKLAECTGMPVFRTKVTIFVLSCGLVGISGALSAFFIRFIDPTSFSMVQSLNFVVMNIVGGMYQLAGSIVGTLFFVLLPEFLRGYVELQRIIFGVCLIIVMAFLPGGIVGVVAQLRRLARSAWEKRT
jgi:branched-chain amino acid transport system permease protein